MKIGIDIFKIGGMFQGSQTYLLNLVKALGDVDVVNDYVLYCSTNRTGLEGVLPSNFSFRRVYPKTPFMRIPISIPYLLWKDSIDVLHSQYICPPFTTSGNVVTIHDVLFESHSQYFQQKELLKTKNMIRFSAKKADRVITISNFSKYDIIKAYGCPENNVNVVYLGVSNEFKIFGRDKICKVLERYGLNERDRFLFSLGRLEPRKNILNTIKAFISARDKGVGCEKLVIGGPKAFSYKDLLTVAKGTSQESNVLFIGEVAQEDLPAMYGGALCFMYPSFAEGFGLPVLEAMACGVPVITSNVTSLPEISGDAAKYVDPYDVIALTETIVEVCENANLRREMIQKGLENIKRFSWRKTAQETLKIYGDVCSKRKRLKSSTK